MSLSCPEAVFGLLRRAWSFKMEQEQGKEKGGYMTNIWFLLEFGHRFKASERIPGAFVCYPKTNTKAFPNTFYKLCDCNSPTKNPMSPGQEGSRPSSSETPGLPSLLPGISLQQWATVCAACAGCTVQLQPSGHPAQLLSLELTSAASERGLHAITCLGFCPRCGWPWLCATHLYFCVIHRIC